MAEVKYSRRKRRSRRGSSRWGLTPARAAIFGAAVIAGFAIGGALLVYGPRAYNSWRESRLLKRANELFAKHDYDAAINAARDALQIQQQSLPAFYILAEATEKENRPETVAWRAQIARLSPQHLDSQLNLASAALRFGQLETARKALDEVPAQDRDRAAYHVVAGWLARAQGNDGEVEQHFAAAVAQEPGNDLYQFNLAVLQIRSADSDKSDRARETLERLSKVAAYRPGALRALLADAVQHDQLQRAEDFAQDLQMSPQITFADYLLCLDFYRKLDAKKIAAVLEKVKPMAARNPADLALLMDWMNRNGFAAEVLKWTEKLPADVTTNPPASVMVAEAFAEGKNWSRLKRWTRSSSWGESEYLRFAYQAYAARQSRQSAADAEFDALWRSAERAASEKPEREVALARLAGRWNLTAESEQLWLRVMKNSPARREALEALLQIYRANNDLPNLYRTAQRLHETSPSEPALAANYARLALLLDQNTADGHRAAKDAYEKAPKDVSCAMTYAFSLYGLGRTAEGIEVMKQLPAEELHDPHAAVYAAVLLLDESRPDAAQEYVWAAQTGSIFPEEKKLLDEALAKSASSSPVATESAVAPPTPTATPTVTPPAP
ncbi:MAG: tetratricopeptide repeat protein [Verrucomicrobiota bacterium]|nr:tetratricopeptide repeat protein [Verrucomicrobiota bacterium]